VFSPHGLANYFHEVTNSPTASQAQRANTPRPESIIGAVRTAVQGAQAGAGSLLEVLIALNIFIGIANMLPMLPLDGGHVVIALYERIRTRPGRPYYQADAAKLVPVAYAFVVLLGLLVVSAAYLDIVHPVANPFG
jgi:membrane-associated protease RseP (regulator of RpoE activity)